MKRALPRVSRRVLCPMLLGLLCLSCSANLGGGSSGGDASMAPPPDMAPARYSDFPSTPVLDTGGTGTVPSNAGQLFGPPGSGAKSGGPCLLDPEIGALFPNNWLRLRVSLAPPAGQNLFEIRLHTDNQVNDLLVYTTNTAWIMPAAMWTALLAHSQDRPITITIRGAVLSGQKLTTPPALGSAGDFTIAPVSADGTIVYWTTSNGTALRGFKIGDETVYNVLQPAQAGAACVGCHSATPDGNYAGLSASNDPGNGDPAQIALRSVDGKATQPAFLTPSAMTLLGRTEQELPSFSKSHYATGDRILFSMLPINSAYEIIWTDLEATSTTQGTAWDVIARTGDPGMAASANPSHDGKTVLYTSGSQVGAGVTLSDGDLYTVPYNNRKGGAATKVAGASSAQYNEYYPAFSPDDQLIAFSRVPGGQTSYNNAAAEVLVIPAAGGQATRLSANDPPACGGQKSPGVTNSWPKWSPARTQVTAQEVTRTFYWLTFSSTRLTAGTPQLFVVGVVLEGNTLTSYKALYLWNQPATQSNHTPAWDYFQIPLG